MFFSLQDVLPLRYLLITSKTQAPSRCQSPQDRTQFCPSLAKCLSSRSPTGDQRSRSIPVSSQAALHLTEPGRLPAPLGRSQRGRHASVLVETAPRFIAVEVSPSFKMLGVFVLNLPVCVICLYHCMEHCTIPLSPVSLQYRMEFHL